MDFSKEKVLKNINPIISVLLIGVCFMPMVKINLSEALFWDDIKITGVEALLGVELWEDMQLEMSIFAIFLFLFPLVMILSYYVRQMENIRKYVIYISPIGSILALFMMKRTYSSRAEVSVSSSIGFWIYLFLAIVLLALAFLQTFSSDGISKGSINEVRAVSEEVNHEPNTVECQNCGNKVLKGKKFCSKCGSPMLDETVIKEEILCSQCGRKVPKEAKYCPVCGAKTGGVPSKVLCKNCGTELGENVKFCPKCGTRKEINN